MGKLRPVLVAFAMFSRIPMPRVEWDEKAMRYAFAALPLVGVVVALLLVLWHWLSALLKATDILYAGIAVALPLLLTGGIHMDGFCDTVDALSSQADKEKKLEILKDPRIGAFAAIFSGLYLLVLFCVQSSLREAIGLWYLLGAVMISSRALGAMYTLLLPNAREGGLAALFSDGASQKPVYVLLVIWLAFAAGLLFLSGWPLGLSGALGIAAVALWFPSMAKRKFGGITGDLAGFFVQICELVSLLFACGGWLVYNAFFLL